MPAERLDREPARAPGRTGTGGRPLGGTGAAGAGAGRGVGSGASLPAPLDALLWCESESREEDAPSRCPAGPPPVRTSSGPALPPCTHCSPRQSASRPLFKESPPTHPSPPPLSLRRPAVVRPHAPPTGQVELYADHGHDPATLRWRGFQRRAKAPPVGRSRPSARLPAHTRILNHLASQRLCGRPWWLAAACGRPRRLALDAEEGAEHFVEQEEGRARRDLVRDPRRRLGPRQPLASPRAAAGEAACRVSRCSRAAGPRGRAWEERSTPLKKEAAPSER